jgi:hypothetical protein
LILKANLVEELVFRLGCMTINLCGPIARFCGDEHSSLSRMEKRKKDIVGLVKGFIQVYFSKQWSDLLMHHVYEH